MKKSGYGNLVLLNKFWDIQAPCIFFLSNFIEVELRIKIVYF